MFARAVCAVWGHAVDNAAFAARGRGCTRCGRPCLDDGSGVIRVGHTLSCFLRHHTYEPVVERDGHTEYACVRCGHPLLFVSDADPYAARPRFDKRVRYRCGLFGHHVHRVTERHGGTEYACRCGHSFIRQPARREIIHHPPGCVLLGHPIAFVERRGGFSEYGCRRCGHAFLFRRPVAPAGPDRSRPPAQHTPAATGRAGGRFTRGRTPPTR